MRRRRTQLWGSSVLACCGSRPVAALQLQASPPTRCFRRPAPARCRRRPVPAGIETAGGGGERSGRVRRFSSSRDDDFEEGSDAPSEDAENNGAALDEAWNVNATASAVVTGASNIRAPSTAKFRPPPMLLFPWSLWLSLKSAVPVRNRMLPTDGGSNDRRTTKSKPKRRWEVPLTSKPYEGVEGLRSTIVQCVAAIALYFVVGVGVLPRLQPGLSFVDALYFSMASVTTVGYGDIAIVGALAKAFVLFFNIAGVCISVSALGVIAKLALDREHRLMSLARDRARSRLIRMFDSSDNDEGYDEGVEEEMCDVDDEHCWVDGITDDELDRPAPRTVLGALFQAFRENSSDFVVLTVLAWMIKRAEGWSLIDAMYYWNCTSSTIGFGDVCPRTQLGRGLAVAFIPLSVVIAGVFAFVSGRKADKAEKDFLRREITFADLKYLDVDGDGLVCEADFIKFMLLAMQKVESRTVRDLERIFQALDAGKDGHIQKEDLITLRQRKRFSRRLKRNRRNSDRWFETRLKKGVRSEAGKGRRKLFGVTFD
ncbi:hypothetical protein ACHAWF_003550 [Thalassiosira exigua]